MVKKAVLFMGPQGSGKDTQAKLLSDKFGFFHFSTGNYIRKVIYDPELKNNKTIKRERKINEKGVLNTPSWVLKIVIKGIKKWARYGESIVFSGSPRTLFEAFGDKKNQGEMDTFNKEYGKGNVFIFLLSISKEESIKRLQQRVNCSVCHTPLLTKTLNCPLCGGKTFKRKDETKEGILERLKEYETRTKPIFNEFKKRKFKLIKINGTPPPYKIHEKISSYFK